VTDDQTKEHMRTDDSDQHNSNMNPPSDHALINGCINGNARMRERFVIRFSNLVYATVRGVCKYYNTIFDQQDLEDWHNSIFVGLFDNNCWKLQQYKGTKGCSVASWVRIVSISHMKDVFRRIKDVLDRPDRTHPLDWILDKKSEASSALDQLEKAEVHALIKQEIEKLSARYRLILELNVYRELPMSDVARMLKVSENNAYSIKHRAIQKLKENILRKKT
jgi:RNA polymerase sigma factor (sigma-70 family)